jgi:flagellar basal body-associated protein FliL
MSSSTVFHRLFSSSDDIDITLDERIRNEEDSQKRKLYRIIITIIIILIVIFPYICIPILFVLVSKKKDTTNNVRNI